MQKHYKLLTPSGETKSTQKGLIGGYRPRKIYGRMDCRTALAAIAKGGYVQNRVFFRNEATAVACGYRPCAVCMPVEYQKWKHQKQVKLKL